MKKSIVVIFLTLGLTGCFHGSLDATSAPEGFHSYATEEFQVFIPDQWDVLTKNDFKSDIPSSTIAAFRSNLKSPAFTPTVVVLRNDLKNALSTLDYAKLLRAKIGQDLVDYREVDVENSEVLVDGASHENLFVYVEGKESQAGDLKQFMQRVAVKGNRAYIITGAFLPGEIEATRQAVEQIVRSFQVK